MWSLGVVRGFATAGAGICYRQPVRGTDGFCFAMVLHLADLSSGITKTL